MDLDDAALNALLDEIEAAPAASPALKIEAAPAASSALEIEAAPAASSALEIDPASSSGSDPFYDPALHAMLDALESAPPCGPAPTFNASQVGALLGLSPYVTPEQALFGAMLTPCNGLLPAIAAIKASASRVLLHELVASEPALQPAAMQAWASAAAAARAAAGDGAAEAVLASAAAASSAAIAALASAQPAVAAQAAALQQAAAADLTMARGVVGEAAALDAAQAQAGVAIVQRNSALRRACMGAYHLQGRMDGVVPGRGGSPTLVFETKVRTRAMAVAARQPHACELAQLRCYLAILRATGCESVEGRLVERFTCGAVRSTAVRHEQALWATLHAGLEMAAQAFHSIAGSQAALEGLVRANTV